MGFILIDDFDEHGISHSVGLLEEVLRVLVLAVVTGNNRDVGGSHDLLGLTFAAHGDDGGRRGTDELYVISDALLSKTCILRQKSKARVEGFAVGVLDNLENLIAVEIGLG